MATNRTVARTMTFGVRPVSRAVALRMHGQKNACIFTWNQVHSECTEAYDEFCGGVGHKTARAFGYAPSLKYEALSPKMPELRNEHEWLKQYSFSVTRNAIARYAQAWENYFNPDMPDAAKPKFKSRHRDGHSFTIPYHIKLKDGRLWIPKIGWVELKGWNSERPHLDGKPTTATLKYELGRWYAFIVFRVQDDRKDNDRYLGIDLNTSESAIATSAGDESDYPEHLTRPYEIRVNRYTRRAAKGRWWLRSNELPEPRLYNTAKSARHAAHDLGLALYRVDSSNRRSKVTRKRAKAERKIKRIRHDWQHDVTTAICRSASIVAVEDLKVKKMTRKEHGKRGINREFLRTAPAATRKMLEYKAFECVPVPPAYTSQQCSECRTIDKQSRSGRTYDCRSCGYTDSSHVNAAINIELAGGLPASGRMRAEPLGCLTTRQYTLHHYE